MCDSTITAPAGNGAPPLSGEVQAAECQITIEVSAVTRYGRRRVIASAGSVREVDEFNTTRAEERRVFINAFARQLSVAPESLEHLHGRLLDQANAADAAANTAADFADEQRADESEARDLLADVPAEVCEAATAFLNNPRMFDEMSRDFEQIGIVGEGVLSRSIYLVCTSRKLGAPLSACVQAASSSGKSYVTDRITQLFPADELIQATSLTPQALFYMREGSLRHRIVTVGERRHTDSKNMADMANATMALREMISRGALDKYIPLKGDDGGMETVHLHQDGPIAYIETTTQETIFDEDATRLLALTTDETAEQTQHILRQQAAEAAGRASRPAVVEEIRLKHQVAQLMLEQVTVLIPYAEHLSIPHYLVAARRAFPQLLGMIRTVALLRQRQKQITEGTIEADAADYEVAYQVMLPILRRAFLPATEKVMELYHIIQGEVRRNPLNQRFTRQLVRDWSRLTDGTVRNRLRALEDAGLVLPVQGSQGRSYHYELAPAGCAGGPGFDGLLTPDALRERLGSQAA